jgi:hypothetical protein
MVIPENIGSVLALAAAVIAIFVALFIGTGGDFFGLVTRVRMKAAFKWGCVLAGTGASIYLYGWGFWSAFGGCMGGLVVWVVLWGRTDIRDVARAARHPVRPTDGEGGPSLSDVALGRESGDPLTPEQGQAFVHNLLDRPGLLDSVLVQSTERTPESQGILDTESDEHSDSSGTVVKIMFRPPNPNPDDEECDAYIDMSADFPRVYARVDQEDGNAVWAEARGTLRGQLAVIDGDTLMTLRATHAPELAEVARDLITHSNNLPPRFSAQTLSTLSAMNRQDAREVCIICGVDPNTIAALNEPERPAIMGAGGKRRIDLG